MEAKNEALRVEVIAQKNELRHTKDTDSSDLPVSAEAAVVLNRENGVLRDTVKLLRKELILLTEKHHIPLTKHIQDFCNKAETHLEDITKDDVEAAAVGGNGEWKTKLIRTQEELQSERTKFTDCEAQLEASRDEAKEMEMKYEQTARLVVQMEQALERAHKKQMEYSEQIRKMREWRGYALQERQRASNMDIQFKEMLNTKDIQN